MTWGAHPLMHPGTARSSAVLPPGLRARITRDCGCPRAPPGLHSSNVVTFHHPTHTSNTSTALMQTPTAASAMHAVCPPAGPVCGPGGSSPESCAIRAAETSGHRAKHLHCSCLRNHDLVCTASSVYSQGTAHARVHAVRASKKRRGKAVMTTHVVSLRLPQFSTPWMVSTGVPVLLALFSTLHLELRDRLRSPARRARREESVPPRLRHVCVRLPRHCQPTLQHASKACTEGDPWERAVVECVDDLLHTLDFLRVKVHWGQLDTQCLQCVAVHAAMQRRVSCDSPWVPVPAWGCTALLKKAVFAACDSANRSRMRDVASDVIGHRLLMWRVVRHSIFRGIKPLMLILMHVPNPKRKPRLMSTRGTPSPRRRLAARAATEGGSAARNTPPHPKESVRSTPPAHQ